MVAELGRRRTWLLGALRDMGLSTPQPRGAFYLFPDVSAHLDARGSVGFCEDLLDAHDLAIVPGTAFGQEGHVRLSYTLGMERLRSAAERLRAFLGARAGARA
jgi:aspartate/methionine/tyrosine aminotransferase